MERVRIKLTDGSVRILDAVWNVPNLNKNIISLITLDLKEYKFIGEGGIMKVHKGLHILL